VIPDGTNSQIQSLHVSVYKPLKDYLRKEYKAYLIRGNLPQTPSGKIKGGSASKLATGFGRLEEYRRNILTALI
jgi:hypothetical protein